ncbi:MAG TPA: hypothetical protein VJ696_09810 [Rhodanobacteraceae bacterium]|nr:hypothetical protein [Rhodanobacteraceae bacterium]
MKYTRTVAALVGLAAIIVIVAGLVLEQHWHVFGGVVSLLTLAVALSRAADDQEKAAAAGNSTSSGPAFFARRKAKRAIDRDARLCKGLSEPEFVRWSTRFLRDLYGGCKENLVSVADHEYAAVAYPAVSLPPHDRVPPQFPKEILKPPVRVLDSRKATKEQADFLALKTNAGKVREPDRPGFSLLEMRLDSFGRVSGLVTGMTNYGRTLVSCHILEVELHREYLLARRAGDAALGDFARIAARLRNRQIYHEGSSTPGHALLRPGPRADAMLSVQAIVCYRSPNLYQQRAWKVLVTKRSEDTAVKPGFYQFQPSGGFEIPPGIDESLFVSQFDPLLTLFREYAEELFGHDEFGVGAMQVSSEDIRTQPAVARLLEMVAHGTAWIDYLGVAIDLTLMRHELCFAITIDDDGYVENSMKLGGFRGLEAAKGFEMYSVAEVIQLCANRNFVGSSVGLLYLALQCERWKSMGVSSS